MHHTLCWNSITYTIHVGICMHVIAFNIPICYNRTVGAPRAMMSWEGRRNSGEWGGRGKVPRSNTPRIFPALPKGSAWINRPAGARRRQWLALARRQCGYRQRAIGAGRLERLPPWLTAGGDRIEQMLNPQESPPDVTPYWTVTTPNPRYPSK
jgi:hypothetical protein